MMMRAMWHSILQVPTTTRCRIHSFSFLGSTYRGRLTESLFTSRSTCHAHALHARWISRPISARIGQRSCDLKSSEPSNLRHEFLDTTGEQNIKNNNSLSRNFASIRYSDAEPIILEMGNSKCLVRLFGLDIETTGFFRDGERIIEIAIRDLSGGKNSCFQTLVNPERHVPNSHIHGITTKMVNRSYVPRMEDLIPILIKYVNSRLGPGEIAIFVAHNARRFDVPFLAKEFSRCSMNIPDNWRFLDTLPLARELMKQKGSVSSKTSLQALREYFGIPLEGSAHRAMSDVNSLASILERITSELNFTLSDLLKTSFRANFHHSKKNKK
ncbi:exonuclease domain-containing protein [Citrus sinensis]|nr:exonuclease domain-containing protein [Citrus sinensis]